MTDKKTLKQRVKEFVDKGKNEAKKLTVPKWAVDYAERIHIHELRIADAIAVRSIYSFFEGWLRIITVILSVACLVSFIAFSSVRGMIITLGDAMYIPLSNDGQLVNFPNLAVPLEKNKIESYLEGCLEGLYSLNSLSYQKTFKATSNKCFSRSKQQKLAISVVESNIFEFIGQADSKSKQLSKGRLVGFDVQEMNEVGQNLSDQGFMTYGYEVKGIFTKYDMATGVRQAAPATFQVVLRNVVPFASESGLTIMSARLKWDRQIADEGTDQ
jgi:hypothetical protein